MVRNSGADSASAATTAATTNTAPTSQSFGGSTLDLSDDEPSSALSTPLASAHSTASSYFSGTASPEVLEGYPPDDRSSQNNSPGARVMADSKAAALSRQIQLRVQQQLGGGLAINNSNHNNNNHPVAATPSDRTGSYVPTDWNWSTF